MAEESRTSHRNSVIEGRIETSEGWTVAYRFKPRASSETFVFLNGLGDDLTSWTWFADSLKDVQTLQVDMRGQGRSLAARRKTHPTSSYRISMAEQSSDLAKLVTNLGIDSQVTLCGFSYGGGIAIDFASRHRERVKTLALIVPFVIRLDHAFPMQRLFTWQWRTLKSFGVLPESVSRPIERGYEEFLSAYMNQRYERRLEDDDARKVAVQLSHGIMEFNTFDILDDLPKGSVHLLTSDFDTLVPRSLYSEFWSRLPEEKKGSWTRVPDGEHLLLEQKPALVLDWIRFLA